MRRFVFCLLVGIAPWASAQNRILDSLTRALEHHSANGEGKVDILNQLSFRILKYQPERSLGYAQHALSLAQQLRFQRGIGEAKNNLAIYHLLKGQVDVALSEVLEAEKIGAQEARKDLLVHSYAILGSVYQNQLAYDKALSYLRQAQNLNKQLDNAVLSSRIFNSLGLITLEKKEYDSGLFYFKKALKVMEEKNEDYRLPEVINNIGLTYTKQGNNALAKEYYYQSLEAAKKSNNLRAQALALSNIGNTILFEKKYVEAEKILLQSLSISKEIKEAKILGACYMALGQLKNETGKFDEAHSYLSAFYEQKDSLLNVERVKKIAELEVKYETEKKEHAIELLERDNKIQVLWTNILFVAFVGVAIVLLVLYYLQEQRDRKNRLILNLEIEQLTTQNKELSEKYKDVLASVNGKGIESSDQRLLKKAIEVVESNLSDPLFGVEQMAKEMGMSRTNMHRKIKAITGFPPSELIRNIRLRKAATLLLNKADSVSQISFIVGFEDHSYFSKSFKKQFGVAPSEYFQSKEQLN